ncbi:hypothetical protein BDB01DRAFT_849498 [Pilobolus umbonatus]|nr:hypothetical protein BDB01DRAFT_849498 [Pilobolus umbonatus]
MPYHVLDQVEWKTLRRTRWITLGALRQFTVFLMLVDYSNKKVTFEAHQRLGKMLVEGVEGVELFSIHRRFPNEVEYFEISEPKFTKTIDQLASFLIMGEEEPQVQESSAKLFKNTVQNFVHYSLSQIWNRAVFETSRIAVWSELLQTELQAGEEPKQVIEDNQLQHLITSIIRLNREAVKQEAIIYNYKTIIKNKEKTVRALMEERNTMKQLYDLK